jgi:cold-inducible RNA-binding protein
MKLYVGNLPFETNDASLNEAFSQHGAVSSANVVMDRETGRSRGFGFVEMNGSDARTAMEQMDGFEMGGRRLKVNEAKPRESRGGGGGRW